MAPVFVPPPELGVDVDVDAAGKQDVVGHSVQVRLDSTQVSPAAQVQTGSVHVIQLRNVRWLEKSRRTVRVSKYPYRRKKNRHTVCGSHGDRYQ